MQFKRVLDELVASGDEVLAALFLDDTGEVVELASRGGSDFDVKVTGAYLGICLRQVASVSLERGLGTPGLLHIERDRLHLHAAPLADGYFLALLQRRPALAARARRSLERAAETIRLELFAPEPGS